MKQKLNLSWLMKTSFRTNKGKLTFCGDPKATALQHTDRHEADTLVALKRSKRAAFLGVNLPRSSNSAHFAWSAAACRGSQADDATQTNFMAKRSYAQTHAHVTMALTTEITGDVLCTFP